MGTTSKWQCALLCLLLCFTTVGCGETLDTQRRNVRTQTPGEAIYEELCNRVAIAADHHDVSGTHAATVCRDGRAPAPWQGERLRALHGQRERVIGALDAALADGTARAGKELIGALAPLYDNEHLVRQLVDAQANAVAGFAQDANATAAFGRLGARRGYEPADLQWGWLLRALTYPELHGLAQAVVPMVAGQGVASGEFGHLLKAAWAQFYYEPEALVAAPDGEIAALRDFLLSSLATEEPFVASNGQAGAPLRVVARDPRGLAQVALRQGALLPPFVDRDGDGLADSDASGAFVDWRGKALELPTPFALDTELAGSVPRNARGEALADDGEPLYVYTDLRPSVLAAATAQMEALVQRDPAQAVAWAPALQTVLGDPTQVWHDFGDAHTLAFSGYDANRTPLVDIAQALGALASKDVLAEVLELAAEILRSNEADVAALVHLGWQVRDWVDAPDMAQAKLAPNNVFADDMLELLADIAREPSLSEHGGRLLDDVLRSMNDPASAHAGALFAAQQRHRDYIELDLNNVNGPPVGRFETPVDRSIPDLRDNRSVFQRILDLVHDASGLQMCNAEIAPGPGYTYAPCEMYQIDDAAIFYVQAIVGTARMRMHLTGEDVEFFETQAAAANMEFMESITGLKGFTRVAYTPAATPEAMAELVYAVTPEACTRLLFAPYYEGITDSDTAGRLAITHLITGDITLDDDEVFAKVHHGTLFAWELGGFFEAVRPMLKAFADHKREDLIVRVMTVLHSHYATDKSDTTQKADASRHDFSHQTGLVTYEPVMARALDEGRALVLAGNLNAAAAAKSVGQGARARSGDALIAELGRDMLLPERHPGMTFFNGKASGRRGDGSALVSRLSPALVLQSALVAMGERMDKLPADSAARRFPNTAAHTYLAVDEEAGAYRLQNRQAKALLTAFMEHGSKRLRHHREVGDLDSVREDLPRNVYDLLAHPLTTAALNLLGRLSENAEATRVLGNVAAYLLGPAGGDTALGLQGALVGLTDAANTLPLLRAAAPMVLPKSRVMNEGVFNATPWLAQPSGVVDIGVEFLAQALPLDVEQTLPRLLAGLARPNRDLGAAPLPVLTDVFTQVNRVQPGAGGALKAPDFTLFLGTLRDFLRDDSHGLGRLLTITEQRAVH